ncbi:signal transduction histidine kinase [Sphingomonas kyeonggiensis]|uniref:sensor histidine kinase n=1 Tax=Sphingomonas kyeonggiensis TaxID=1268553 RepID=UPI00277E0BE4|nr:HAMP domain-containing sensor histidine kinase [Sphingomonas kyeonggiensis]MDQ0250448.1 signal transduction histidine kinase [Sphingomonas kyeonggiensis]
MAPLRSLRAIAFAFLTAIALATVLTCLAVYLALLATIDRQIDKRLHGEAAELLADGPDQTLLMQRIMEETRRRDSGDIGFLLTDRNGRHLAGNMTPAHGFPPGLSTIDQSAGIPGLTRGRALVHALPEGMTLALAAESEPIDDHDAQRLLILASGFGAILLLVGLGIFALSLAIRRNIEAVRSAAEAIVDGDLRARVPVEGAGTAFGRQAQAFNHMLDRIEALMTSLSQISNDVAHDLRTPLARLHGQLSRLAAEPTADALRPQVEEALAQSEEILAMFAAILRITEVEGGDRRAMFRRLDLSGVAQNAAEAIEALADDKAQALRLGPWEAAPIDGDERLLTQLVVNLVENAVNHTPAGSTITVSVARDGDAAVLTVADNGPGIAPDEQARALLRFGRLEASRNRPGHGLGLPLVQAITALHRGTLELANAAPGLAVRIRLPLAH